jgi:GntR family transcriptional regulator
LAQQPREKPTTRYRLIADELRAAIKQGTYRPGDRLPSETELMEQHSVSRGTAREALATLRAEGLAEARRGSGVYVRSFRQLRRNATERLASTVWGTGRSIWDVDVEDRPLDTTDVTVEEIDAPEHVAGCLGTTRVWMRSRTYTVEGRNVQRAVSYLPSDLVAGSPITELNTGPGGTYARLADLGHAPVRFREEVKARMPIGDEVTTLGLGSGTPVVLIARTAFDASGRPVEVNEMVLDSSSYLLQYDFPA